MEFLDSFFDILYISGSVAIVYLIYRYEKKNKNFKETIKQSRVGHRGVVFERYKTESGYAEYHNKFSMNFEEFSIRVQPARRSSGLRGRYSQISTSLPLELPKFALKKSTNISHIIYTSDLLPQELSNVNVETNELTQASLWFNVSPFIKFVAEVLPFKSKYGLIESTGREVHISLHTKEEYEEIMAYIQLISMLYTKMAELLDDDDKRRQQVRITTKMTLHCNHCGASISVTQDDCHACGADLPRCIICYLEMDENSGLFDCCGSYVHRDHLNDIGSTCPYCKQKQYEIISLEQ